jgi:hypothetical protein
MLLTNVDYCIISHACNTLSKPILLITFKWCLLHHHLLGSGSPPNGWGYVWRRSNPSWWQVHKPQAYLYMPITFSETARLLCLHSARPDLISFSFVSLCRLFQVTWLKNDGFIYDRHNFTKVCYRSTSCVYPSYSWSRSFALNLRR